MDVWHKRFGHVSPKTVKFIFDNAVSRHLPARRPCTAKLRNHGAAQQSGMNFSPPIRSPTEFRQLSSRNSTGSRKLTTKPSSFLGTRCYSMPASPLVSSARHSLTQTFFEIDYPFQESAEPSRRTSSFTTAPMTQRTLEIGVAIVTQRGSIRRREKQRTYPDMRQVDATYTLEKQLKVEWDSAA